MIANDICWNKNGSDMNDMISLAISDFRGYCKF